MWENRLKAELGMQQRNERMGYPPFPSAFFLFFHVFSRNAELSQEYTRAAGLSDDQQSALLQMVLPRGSTVQCSSGGNRAA